MLHFDSLERRCFCSTSGAAANTHPFWKFLWSVTYIQGSAQITTVCLLNFHRQNMSMYSALDQKEKIVGLQKRLLSITSDTCFRPYHLIWEFWGPTASQTHLRLSKEAKDEKEANAALRKLTDCGKKIQPKSLYYVELWKRGTTEPWTRS